MLFSDLIDYLKNELSEIYGRILKYTFINTSTCHTDEGSVRLY